MALWNRNNMKIGFEHRSPPHLNFMRLQTSVLGLFYVHVTGEWRKLHNEELNDMYSSPHLVWVIKSRRTRWAGHVARMGERRGVYRVLVGKPEGKRPLRRPRRR